VSHWCLTELFYFCSGGDGTLGLGLARQVLHTELQLQPTEALELLHLLNGEWRKTSLGYHIWGDERISVPQPLKSLILPLAPTEVGSNMSEAVSSQTLVRCSSVFQSGLTLGQVACSWATWLGYGLTMSSRVHLPEACFPVC
jgi:hypothetical protein